MMGEETIEKVVLLNAKCWLCVHSFGTVDRTYLANGIEIVSSC